MSAPSPGGPPRLVVFTRYPEPGRAKTRLIPALGAEGAARLQREMTEWTLARIAGERGGGEDLFCRVEVRYEGGDAGLMRAWLGDDARCTPQGGGDLGARLARAFAEAFAGGAPAAAIVGSDCPGLCADDVRAAFAALEGHDAVFGPAADGGYYLVGLRRAAADRCGPLFAGIPWGGARVLAASRDAAARAGLSSALLRTLADVDRPADLAVWERETGRGAGARGTDEAISVVVPALDEAARIGPLVAALLREGAAEVIVADGGSADGTREAAAAAGARVVRSARGRAPQLNAGAAAAAGPILLFLHADTLLPAGWAAAVRGHLARPRVAAGAFSFGTDSRRFALRVIEAAAAWRARVLGVFFGDQALFVRAAVFARAGGFPDQPLLEDYELVRRLRRQGRVQVLAPRVRSSARRWEALGPWRTSAVNAAITVAYLAGAPAERLARWYRRAADRGRTAARGA